LRCLGQIRSAEIMLQELVQVHSRLLAPADGRAYR
jgi:hypothetical protein